MKPARSEILKAAAEGKFYRDFYCWLERIVPEKINESRGTLQRLANQKVTDSRPGREDVRSSVLSDLVSLCAASVRRELRTLAVQLGEQEVAADKAQELLAKRTKELLAIAHARKWSFGLRLLESLRSSGEPFRLDDHLRGDLWNIVKTSVEGLHRDWLLDIEDGRYARRKSDARNDLVLRFKGRLAEEGYRITDSCIWHAAKHKQARQFYYWKRGEDRQAGQKRGATLTDNRSFRWILAMDVPTFLEHLRKLKLRAPTRSRP
jgi:hypothetical protein